MIVAFVCSMELILIPNCSLLYLHSFLEKAITINMIIIINHR